jgi:hypothetical protein
MKHFAIGDGNKRITCEGRYFADRESDDTTVIWDPDHADIPIRATVITIVPKDKSETEIGYWRVIEKAREQGRQPKVQGNKSIHSYSEPSQDPGDVLYFYEVGFGNNICFFSVTLSEAKESSPGFRHIQSDLESMLQTLVERGEEEQFQCELLVCELDRIQESVKTLLSSQIDETSFAALQKHLDRSLEIRDENLAGMVGLVFGELMRHEVPSFSWVVLVDDYGSCRALAFGDSGIIIFPEDMILKRFDKGEHLELEKFASDALDTAEGLYRKYQQAASAGGEKA